MNCENCGIPQGSYSHPGHTLSLNFRVPADRSPEFGKKRDQRRTVWTCGPNCAVQTMAIAAMGLPTHKWPMTFNEFVSQARASGRLDFLKAPKGGLTVTKTIEETQQICGSEKANFQKPIQVPTEGVFVTKRNGRPRVENPLSQAQRARRYRSAKRQPIQP